ncbi:MAG: N-acetylmuramoyl-L-alanine amidase [Acidobacteriaceae bacterium]
MRWISKGQTTETKRLTQGPLKARRDDWAGLSRSAAIGILFGCCVWAAQAQQSQTQTGTQPAATPPSSTLQVPPAAQATPAQANIPAATQPRPTELRYLVLLDPAHGGTDTGAMLDPATPEKTYTLALAEQLRAALNARGVRTLLTRTADMTLDNDARATTANRSHASACISLHATSTGNGVHLFTSSLPAMTEADPRRAFLPWQTAQAAYETSSLRLESDVDAAMTQQHIPVLIARTSIQPLDSMACPAVDVEVAPQDANTPLSDAGYRQKVVDALDAALVAWRSDWRQQP